MDERVQPQATLLSFDDAAQNGVYRYAVITLKDGAPICDREADRSDVCDALSDIAEEQAAILTYLISDYWVGLILETSSADTPTKTVHEIAERCTAHLTGRCDTSQHTLFSESVRLHNLSDVLAVVRHCHRFPVDTGIVSDASDYHWTSHRAYLGRERVKWLTRSPVASMLANEPGGWPAGYQRLMAELSTTDSGLDLLSIDVPLIPASLDPDHRSGLELLKFRPIQRTFERIVDAVLSITACDHDAFHANSRNTCFALQRALIAWHATQAGIMSFSAVAQALGCDRSRLYKTLKRFQATEHSLFAVSLPNLLKELTISR